MNQDSSLSITRTELEQE